MKPVQALAFTIQCVLSYLGTPQESPICTYFYEGKLQDFTQANILDAFRQNAAIIVKEY